MNDAALYLCYSIFATHIRTMIHRFQDKEIIHVIILLLLAKLSIYVQMMVIDILNTKT